MSMIKHILLVCCLLICTVVFHQTPRASEWIAPTSTGPNELRPELESRSHGTDSIKKSLYRFVKSIIDLKTGLAASREGDCFTTVYKNSLSAMSLLHQGDIIKAERIFEIFKKYYKKRGRDFRGFPKDWDACTGRPLKPYNFWEKDQVI
jgi:hypothetical protein